MRRPAWGCVLLLIGVGACSTGPPLRTYLLTPPIEPTALAPERATPIVQIAVPRVRVPDYLDTTDLLLRDGNYEVKTSKTGRWDERLSQGLTHALAADLVARLPDDEVVTDRSTTAKRRLWVNIDALDVWPDGRCVIAATWTIVGQEAKDSISSGSETFQSSPSGSTASIGDIRLVDAISGTVGKLADAIAHDIQQSAKPDP